MVCFHLMGCAGLKLSSSYSYLSCLANIPVVRRKQDGGLSFECPHRRTPERRAYSRARKLLWSPSLFLRNQPIYSAAKFASSISELQLALRKGAESSADLLC